MRRLLALALLLGLGLAACRRDGNGPRAVDEKLVVALEEARAWQHRADTHLEGGDVAGAIADVEAVLKVQFPAGAPEGEEARLDAWARLAKLRLGTGDDNAALAAVDAGRKEATRDSFYRAHLETTAGEIWEARAKRLDGSDKAAAASARREALAAYERSIQIDKRVQAALLREGTP